MVIPNYRIGPLTLVDLVPYLAMVCILGFILLIVPLLIWIERVVIALVQDRLGPNRVGPRGLLQSIADGIKLFFKEDVRPAQVDRFLYYAAPVMTMIPALAAGAVIPFGQIRIRTEEGVQPIALVVGDVNIGILFVLGLASLQVYGIVLAGWASNNKYALLGGLRSSAQIISYELAMSLAVLTGILIGGSLQLTAIVENQSGYWLGFLPKWNVFQFFGLGFIATVIYLIAMVAETNRAPFDLPEAESELIAGFHTEYSSMKFAMFFMGEYASMLVVCGLATALWFGGWHSPINPAIPVIGTVAALVPGFVWFLAKLMFFMLGYVWLRATLPRLRYDALMRIGWKRMLPLALCVLFAVAVVDLAKTPADAGAVGSPAGGPAMGGPGGPGMGGPGMGGPGGPSMGGPGMGGPGGPGMGGPGGPTMGAPGAGGD